MLKTGGSVNPYQQLEVFLSMIILGYFGVKVIYGIFFKFYPDKYYYRNIEINTSDKSSNSDNTTNLVVNAYMPGMWNTEITDFVVTVILGLIIYVYTNMSTRSMIDDNGNINLGLLIGYIIGLGYPPIAHTLSPVLDSLGSNSFGQNIINCISIFIFVVLLIIIVIINYANGESLSSRTSYITYFAVVLLLLFGLFYARKRENTVGPVTYNFSTEESCNRKEQKYIMSSGEMVKITPVFIVFICLLLFSYNPDDVGMNYLYIIVFGILLGVFVSGISYYGIEYFLIKQPVKQCDSLSQCDILDDLTEEQVTQGLEAVNNNQTSINLVKVFIIIGLIIVFGYLFYIYFKK